MLDNNTEEMNSVITLNYTPDNKGILSKNIGVAFVINDLPLNIIRKSFHQNLTESYIMRKQIFFILSAFTLMISTSITAIAAIPITISNPIIPSFAPMLKSITPAVVNIAIEGKHVSNQQLPETSHFSFGPNFPTEQIQEYPFRALGSGVIIDAQKGYIVTNYHVVNGANKIMVQLYDGHEVSAKLVGGNKQSDIALLQISTSEKLIALKLANSDKLQVGDFAVAIGDPFGIGQTVTFGIISALGRSDLNIENLENFIQTDAAINSGNSGGALINLKGELIGINTAILGPGHGNVGIGFAIPSNMIKNITTQIIKFGQVHWSTLGIKGQKLTAELAAMFGYNTVHGAFVNQVIPHSAAQKAGLKAGDIIISINNNPIYSFNELRTKIATLEAGKTISLHIIRDGKHQQIKVSLSIDNNVTINELSLTGAKFINMTINNQAYGVKVTELQQESIAAHYGLMKNDIIIGLNRLVIKNLTEFRRALDKQPKVLALKIKRDNNILYLIIH